MNIRNATYHDAPAIKLLLEALGYQTTFSMVVDQLEILFGKGDHQVYGYELRKEVVGFVSVHYLPQLAFDGRLALISYLSVDETVKNTAAKVLEEYVTGEAIKRKCHKIQVHCSDLQVQANQFYERQGYEDSSKYLSKLLTYLE